MLHTGVPTLNRFAGFDSLISLYLYPIVTAWSLSEFIVAGGIVADGRVRPAPRPLVAVGAAAATTLLIADTAAPVFI